MNTSRPLRRSGFTLTELLVVISIITVILAMVFPAVQYARNRALRTSIRVEVNQLSSGMYAFKEKYGDFPPDFTSKRIVRSFIYRAWPRINPTEFANAWAQFWARPLDDNDPQSNVDPAEALVFWLGGFSSNSSFPFTGEGGPWVVDSSGNVYANPERVKGAHDFEQEKDRLTFNTTPIPFVDANGENKYGWVSNDTASPGDIFPVLIPERRKVPYVYFDARNYGGNLPDATVPAALKNGFYTVAGGPPPVGHGYARPYLSRRPKPVTVRAPYGFEWINADSFQIISAGLDDCYGGDAFLGNVTLFPQYPTGENYLSPGPGDDDNITNFDSGSMRE